VILCETCIHWQGGRGVQKGVSLCAKHKAQRYVYPDALGAPEGYAPKNKRCHQDAPPVPKRKVRRRVTR
jgi:hypothetical protein